jgi:hypothetical protein
MLNKKIISTLGAASLCAGLMYVLTPLSINGADVAPSAPAAPVAKGPPLALPFNDDFESGELKTDIWTPHVANGGTVTLVQGKGGYGKYVLQAHLPAAVNRSIALVGTTRLPDALSSHAFGRAYVYISPNGPPQHTVLTYSGTAGWPQSNWLEVGMYKGAVQTSYQQQMQGLAREARGEAVAFGKTLPTGKWFCLEWEVNDAPDSLTVWADGEEVSKDVFTFKTFGNTNLVKGFADFGFGVRTFGQVPDGLDVYYDNVAFDSKRIGPLKSPPAPMPATP